MFDFEWVDSRSIKTNALRSKSKLASGSHIAEDFHLRGHLNYNFDEIIKDIHLRSLQGLKFLTNRRLNEDKTESKG